MNEREALARSWYAKNPLRAPFSRVSLPFEFAVKHGTTSAARAERFADSELSGGES